VPLAPTHKSKNRVNNISAPAQPMPAVITLACPLPGMLCNITYIPAISAKSTELLKKF